jgi:hypothetical protein
MECFFFLCGSSISTSDKPSIHDETFPRYLKFFVQGEHFDSGGSLSRNYFSGVRVQKLEWSIPRRNNETRLEPEPPLIVLHVLRKGVKSCRPQVVCN